MTFKCFFLVLFFQGILVLPVEIKSHGACQAIRKAEHAHIFWRSFNLSGSLDNAEIESDPSHTNGL